MEQQFAKIQLPENCVLQEIYVGCVLACLCQLLLVCTIFESISALEKCITSKIITSQHKYQEIPNNLEPSHQKRVKTPDTIYKTKKTYCNEVVRCPTEYICIEDIYEMTTEMENKYQLQISSELNKERPVVVANDFKKKMIEQF